MKRCLTKRLVSLLAALSVVSSAVVSSPPLVLTANAAIAMTSLAPAAGQAGTHEVIAGTVAVNSASGISLSSVGTETGFLQFASAGHVLGFSKDGVIVASASHMLKIDFLNSNAVIPEAENGASGESSTGNAPALGRVTYREVWDGVTVVYEASNTSIAKITYFLDTTKEGTPVDRIRLGYNRPVHIDEKGNLIINYENGTLIEGSPLAWQEIEGRRKPVTASYILRGEREVGFSLGDYVPGIPVVIDPWLTFLGGSGNVADVGYGIAVDSSGNVYVTGFSTAAWGSPVRAYTTGDNLAEKGSDWGAFVAKLDSSGTLQWNTFLDGSGADVGYGIAVDDSGNVYVTGYSTATWGSPVRAYRAYTTGDNLAALGSSYWGDTFAAKLNSSGALQWNTFLGGSGADVGYGIAVNNSGNVYVSGHSTATWGSPVRAYTPGYDLFVAELNSRGALQWNTFLGGSGTDRIGGSVNGIAVDGSGNVYVAGYSTATWGSPVRAYTSGGSGNDAFAAKLDSKGVLQWNTFLGGSGTDLGWCIAVNSSGNVYVTGHSTAAWGSPVRAFTPGYDLFVAELDSSGVLKWNTFLGGSGVNYSNGIAVDSTGNIYVSGYSTATWGSPVRAYTGGGGGDDLFVAELDSSGTLQWNTFLGGSGVNYSNGIAVNSNGNVHISGFSNQAWSSPVRSNNDAKGANKVVSNDAFAAKLEYSGRSQASIYFAPIATPAAVSPAMTTLAAIVAGGLVVMLLGGIFVTSKRRKQAGTEKISLSKIIYALAIAAVLLVNSFGCQTPTATNNLTEAPASSTSVVSPPKSVTAPAVQPPTTTSPTLTPKPSIPPKPASFVLGDLTITPTSIMMGEQVTYSIPVSNTGGTEGSYIVVFKYKTTGGAFGADNVEVTLKPGETRTATLTKTQNNTGTCFINVNNKSSQYTISYVPAPIYAVPATSASAITSPPPSMAGINTHTNLMGGEADPAMITLGPKLGSHPGSHYAGRLSMEFDPPPGTPLLAPIDMVLVGFKNHSVITGNNVDGQSNTPNNDLCLWFESASPDWPGMIIYVYHLYSSPLLLGQYIDPNCGEIADTGENAQAQGHLYWVMDYFTQNGNTDAFQALIGYKVKRGEVFAYTGRINSFGLAPFAFKVSDTSVNPNIQNGNNHLHWVQPNAFFYWKCYSPDTTFPSGVLAYPFECDGYQLPAEQHDVNFKYTAKK